MLNHLLRYTLMLLGMATFFYPPALHAQNNKTLGVTKHLSGGQEDGYVLYTPFNSDTIYAINKCGKKVHTWVSEYASGYSFYLLPDGNLLKSGIYNDTVFGNAGGRGGIIEKLDWNSNVTWRYKIFNDSLCQHHDIAPLPNGNVLVIAWHTISRQAAINLGRDTMNFAKTQTELWGERIIELKPIGSDSAVVVWQWDLFDHVVQEFDASKPSYSLVSNHPELLDINYAVNLQTQDWIHANGLDYNEGLDQIVLSSHNTSEIWIIDHSTTTAQAKTHAGGKYGQGGDFLYRWGNPQAYRRGVAKDRKLFGQHNPQWIRSGLVDSGCIMIFNNGLGRDTAYSSIEVIQPPLQPTGNYVKSFPYAPIASKWVYKDSVPTKFFSQIISGAQRLPNGNTLICHGTFGKFFEVTQQKKTVWEYINPAGPTNIQSDGQTPAKIQIFRCKFYQTSYPAFNNKNMSPGGTIERSPYPYTCDYEAVPPKLSIIAPKHKDTSVALNSRLSIAFTEPVIKRFSGSIKIFENNVLQETINVQSDSVKISGTTAIIGRTKPFKLHSRVSVLIAAGCFRDSSFNINAALDSSKWFFFTPRPVLGLVSLTPANLSVDVPLNSKLQLLFKDDVLKSASGNIIITEDGTQKEVIGVQDVRVAVSGKIVTITPSAPFKLDAQIKVSVDTCFKNAAGGYNHVVPANSWTFRTPGPPKIVSLSPANAAVDIAKNASFLVTFDKEIVRGTAGNVMVYENGFLKALLTYKDTNLKIQGKTMVIDPVPDMIPGAHISLAIRQDLVEDSMGNGFTGLDSADWVFSIKKDPGSAIDQVLSGKGYCVFPNPSNGQLTLALDMSIKKVSVIDLMGREVEFIAVPVDERTLMIQVKNSVPGVYTLKVNDALAIKILLQ